MIPNMVATDLSRSIRNPGSDSLYTLWEQCPSKLWVLGAVTLVLGLAYAPNFRALFSKWSDDPSYSHGYLVIPIALVILWQRLSDPKPESSKTSSRERPANPGWQPLSGTHLASFSSATPAPWWGWIFLIAVLAMRAVAYERSFEWVETATILPVVVGLTWTLGGWPLLRRVWPAIVFLVFMLPLPQSIDNSITLPLQGLAASGSCFLLQMSGLWAVQDGNVIRLSTPGDVIVPLDVAIACSGLKMLMMLTATIVATIVLISLPTWKRICLLLSVVPIALFSNMIRIVATGWCYYRITGPSSKEWAHDISGWLMMPLALVLVALESASCHG